MICASGASMMIRADWERGDSKRRGVCPLTARFMSFALSHLEESKMRKTTKRRKEAFSTYCHRYEILQAERIDGMWLCIYCGSPADTVDHVPPVSRISDCDSIYSDDYKFCTVKSCLECNKLAGDRLDIDLIDRIDFVKDRLKSKYRRALRIPDWTLDELDDLGDSLRAEVESAIVKRGVLAARIAYPFGYAVATGQTSTDCPLYELRPRTSGKKQQSEGV